MISLQYILGREPKLRKQSYMFRLQLLFNSNLALVQSAEFVDFVLIFSSDLNLVAPSCSFILLGKLASNS
jgi:hypothetical protein